MAKYLNADQTRFYEGDTPPDGFTETELTFYEWENQGRAAWLEANDDPDAKASADAEQAALVAAVEEAGASGSTTELAAAILALHGKGG